MTPKMKLFVAEYLSCFNAKKAAIAAGYSNTSSISNIAHTLINHPEIQEAIKEHLEATVMLADEVLMRLADHARGNLAYFLDRNMNIDLERAEAQEHLHLLKKVKQRRTLRPLKDGTVIEVIDTEIELHDPQKALELLGKHYALFQERVALSGELAVKGYVSVSPDDWDENNSSLPSAGLAGTALEKQE